MQNQRAELQWRSGDVPVSTRFDDPYFSLDDGLAEARHVFLQGNDLPDRFADGFEIGELGFGTGLNMLAAWAAWEQSGRTTPLGFTSFEAYPMTLSDMVRALSHFPELAEWCDRFFIAFLSEARSCDLPTLRFRLIVGDARERLPDWTGSADAWFLDGFSPAKNPELWGADLMSEVARHTRPAGTAATYSAAGFVRRNLELAGFSVLRAPGYGRKRHMTLAHRI